ncbi:MAG: glycosidase [Flammeovirgaceae bacterium]|nr:glycosidase [Flammeovirgaceae bacterium]MBE63188.1 glycosidase [Flammeovirgaceae bacterium]MBR09095.1 glycosidase [Rickettsiales bacterium]|tara:strand:+ start:999 stop:2084 length:1086 start_codon:yes stop_codon:yes gene_type:complete
MRKIIQLLAVFTLIACSKEKVDEWQLLGFEKQDAVNPIMGPDTTSLFLDPITQRMVKWEGKDVFNPASIVKDDTLFMLYRAEDFVGKFNGTSRIGLAYSFDGLTFTRLDKPVFYPKEDEYKVLEWEGGAEDPRIVKRNDGLYVMTYTAYDGDLARLLVATTNDLRTWEKHGSVFQDSLDINQWSKSGSIVARADNDEMIAVQIDGMYWMYFGDTDLFVAQSSDLIHWDPVKNDTGDWLKVLSPRKDNFDSDLVEPGPPAILTKNGILLIYNSRNRLAEGDQSLPDGTYSAGQALFDPQNPTQLILRSEDYFFTPDKPYEFTGQVNNVCFVEGLCHYKDQWFLYYGTADSKIAVAVSSQLLN